MRSNSYTLPLYIIDRSSQSMIPVFLRAIEVGDVEGAQNLVALLETCLWVHLDHFSRSY
jgi:hypothetical protein